MKPDKRTKIVCTLGPSTEDDEVLREMIRSGMNVARLNFSHGDHAYHQANIERVRRISAELGVPIAIMVDTKGPEIRTRLNVDHKPVRLERGAELRVTARPVESSSGCVALDYENLCHEVGPGDIIFMDDGLIGLTVERVEGDEIVCRVTNGGLLGERKGVNVPNVAVGLPNVTDRDVEDIRFSCELGVDAIAASFVRDAAAVHEIRELCRSFGAPHTTIISKIEAALSIEHIDEIIAASDGIMVARGDLGVEIPPSDVPQLQKEVIRSCNRAYKPVITATQMLESMTHNPRPTRAEVTDVANAIYDGTDCVMLSGETAAGDWPVEAVQMMAEVCRKAERELPERHEYHDRGGIRNVSGATGYGAVQLADLVDAKALICPTLSGRTARIISEFRPTLPIYAATPLEGTLRRCCFYWGVEAVMAPEEESVTRTCYGAVKRAREVGYLQVNDIVIITAGDPLSSPIEPGTITHETPTNMLVIAEAL